MGVKAYWNLRQMFKSKLEGREEMHGFVRQILPFNASALRKDQSGQQCDCVTATLIRGDSACHGTIKVASGSVTFCIRHGIIVGRSAKSEVEVKGRKRQIMQESVFVAERGEE